MLLRLFKDQADIAAMTLRQKENLTITSYAPAPCGSVDQAEICSVVGRKHFRFDF